MALAAVDGTDPAEAFARTLTQVNGFLDVVGEVEMLDDVLGAVVRGICRCTTWSMSSIMQLDPERRFSRLVCEHNPLRVDAKGGLDEWRLATSPALAVAQRNSPVVIADAQAARDMPDYREDAGRWGYRTVVILPLACRSEEGQAMVLSVQSVDVVEVVEADLQLLSTFARLSSMAIDKAQALAREREVSRRLSRVADARADLTMRIAADEGPPAIVSRIAELVGRAVILYDQTSAAPVLATADGQARHLNGAVAARIAKEFHERDPDGSCEEIAFSLPDPDLSLSPFARARAFPLSVGRFRAGGLIVACGREDPPKPSGEAHLREARFAAAVLLVKSVAAFRVHQETLSDLLSTVFSGNWRNADTLVARATMLGLDLTAPHVIFGIPRAAAGEAEIRHEHHTLARTCERLGRAAAIVQEGPLHLVVIPVSQGQEASIDIWAGQVRKALVPHWGARATVIVSRVCADLADYANARREIEDTVKLAEAFDRTGVLETSTFGGTGLLLSCSSKERIAGFVRGTLDPILRADGSDDGWTLKTICCFLAHGCRYPAAAAAMRVHVTTMRYRIDRIETRFGIDFADADTRFELDLALRLHHFIDTPKR